MANALGTLASSLVAQRTLDYLKEMFPPVLRMFIDFTPQQVLLNQSITTRIPGASAAYSAVGGYVAPDVTDTDVPVTATNFKAASVAFTAAQMSSTNRDLVNEHAAALANSLGQDLLDQLCAIFINANYPLASLRTLEDAVNYDDVTLRGIRKKLNVRKAPALGRLGILNSDAFEALSGDDLVTKIDTNANSQDDYALAPMILRARGFTIIEYPQLPANAIDLNGIFMTAGGVVGAVGVPADANAPGMFDNVPNVAAVEVVTDEDTGLSLLQRLHKNSNGGIQMDLAWVFGFAKGNTNCVELVTEAP
jgi:hypothetical protein